MKVIRDLAIEFQQQLVTEGVEEWNETMEVIVAGIAKMGELNRIYAERLSRVTQALTAATELVQELVEGPAQQGYETEKYNKFVAQIKVVNSGLADENPPICAECQGTGLAARASRVAELEKENNRG